MIRNITAKFTKSKKLRFLRAPSQAYRVCKNNWSTFEADWEREKSFCYLCPPASNCPNSGPESSLRRCQKPKITITPNAMASPLHQLYQRHFTVGEQEPGVRSPALHCPWLRGKTLTSWCRSWRRIWSWVTVWNRGLLRCRTEPVIVRRRIPECPTHLDNVIALLIWWLIYITCSNS